MSHTLHLPKMLQSVRTHCDPQFMDHFLLSHQNSARISKIRFLKSLVKKSQKNACFRALKSIFELNVFIGYFGMFEGFKKANPYI